MVDREDILYELRQAETFDLLVIGGGATGCGVALDAATRGLKVALAEKGDFASGTSAKSTKLIHGGVRYLERALLHFDRVQFNLVRDALHERSTLLRIAPHLCHRLPLVIPLYSYASFPYFLAGLKLYDLLAGRSSLGPSRVVSRDEMLGRFPGLRKEGLKGGILFYDGQFNDARMNVALALTALRHGARLANYLEVVDFVKEGSQVTGARVRDLLSGRQWDIAARAVVNACGPFSDELRRLDDPGSMPLLQVSSGAHIVLPREVAPTETGLLIPRTDDGRVLFVLPWLGGCLAGTTDRPASEGEPLRVGEEDIEYLLRHLRRYLDVELERKIVSASWKGLRPLVRDPSASDTASLARDHVIHRSGSGLITITGGKWTTYRKMAQDTVDYALRSAALSPNGTGTCGASPRVGCRTDSIALVGGESIPEDGAAAIADRFAFESDTALHLHRSYGDRAGQVALFCQGPLAERLAPGHPYLKGEVIWAVREELALFPLDFLVRRIPLALLDVAAAKAAAPAVLELMAQELGWNEERVKREQEELLGILIPPRMNV